MQNSDSDSGGIWFVIPAYNESTVLHSVLSEVLDRYQNIVLVNDGSTDDTAEVGASAGAIVVSHATNLGQGAALQTGLEFALSRGAEYIVTFDADGQHSLDDVDKMLASLQRSGCDIALGSRFLGTTERMPVFRRAFLAAAVLFTRLTTGLQLTDTHNGLRIFTNRAARVVKISQNQMAHASELLEQIAENKLRYIEIPVHIKYTEYSLQKGQRLSNSMRILSDLITQRIIK